LDLHLGTLFYEARYAYEGHRGVVTPKALTPHGAKLTGAGSISVEIGHIYGHLRDVLRATTRRLNHA
jgi:hypothetical protein